MHKNVTLEEIRTLILQVLGPVSSLQYVQGDAMLLGAVPELDSIGIMSILLEIESTYAVVIDDDEVDAEIFLSLDTVRAFAQGKINHQAEMRPGAV